MILKKNVMVLASGGIDSTACIHYYLSLDFKVKAFFVNYDQPAFNQEYKSVRKIASYYKIELSSATCHFPNTFFTGEILGRNGFLILTTIMANPGFSGLISLGIHSDTLYYDCTPAFVSDMNKIVEAYSDGRVKLNTPFLTWKKGMIYEYCKNENIPVNLTYSCESNEIKPCGKCLSCLDRRILDVG